MKTFLIISTFLISLLCYSQGGDYDVFPKPYSQIEPQSWMIGKGIKKIWRWEKRDGADSTANGYYEISRNGTLLKHDYFEEKDANEYTYNENGDWVTTVLPNKLWTRIIEYNDKGSITNVRCIEYDALDFTVEYDASNRPIKKTKRNNKYYWTYYDNDSIKTFRSVSVGNDWDSVNTNPSMVVKSYREYAYYDNRLTYIQTDSVTDKQIEIDSIIVDYDEKGQQIGHVGFLYVNGQNYKSYLYTTYDDLGNTLKTEFDGGKTWWFYNDKGLLQKIEIHLDNGEKRETLYYYEFYDN